MLKLLHVGCSKNRIKATTKGFNGGLWEEIRLDIDSSVNPDIVGSMTNMALVEDASVDAVFSSHNIEHLYPHEVPLALREFLRVLKVDGFLVITCPDLKSVCELVSRDKLADPAYVGGAGPISPMDMLYGHRASMAKGNLYMSHRCGFTERVLHGALSENGFKSIASLCRPEAFDLWAVACKRTRTEDEIRSLARQHFPF